MRPILMCRSRASSFLTTADPTSSGDRVVNALPNGAVLAATGIHKRFGALVVLDDVNLSMSQDEAVGIVGPNGAGKTTLLSILAGAFPPSSGSVEFQRTDVTA